MNRETDREGSRLVHLSFEDGARGLNDCGNLFATDIRETDELTLQVVLAEAKAQAPITTVDLNSPVGNILLGARPIETDATCRVFRVIFPSNLMISWSVLNESYGRYPEAPTEVFVGNLFREFSRSKLLDFTRQATNASDGWPGPLKHYQIACLNHVIDVIATGYPIIMASPQTL